MLTNDVLYRKFDFLQRTTAAWQNLRLSQCSLNDKRPLRQRLRKAANVGCNKLFALGGVMEFGVAFDKNNFPIAITRGKQYVLLLERGTVLNEHFLPIIMAVLNRDAAPRAVDRVIASWCNIYDGKKSTDSQQPLNATDTTGSV